MADAANTVYRGYTQAELDAQYDQRTLVPDLEPYVTFWRKGTDEARKRLDCVLDIAYGPSPGETLDLYLPDKADDLRPVHINIHGGAWRLLGKEHAGFPALQMVPAGACYVALNFALATEVPLDEMVRQVRAAAVWIHANIASYGGDPDRVFLSGHSSGAHLSAMILADGWRPAAGLPDDLIKGAILVSGPYDLEPVRLSARNDYLHLDEAAARRNSPIRHIPKDGPPIFVGWGDGELDEFRRQGKAFAAAWADAGLPVEAAEFAGYNHFDVSNAFADADGPIVPVALDQMGLR